MECDVLMLADAAQVQGNKIYVLGGGWRYLTTNQGFPFEHPISIGVGLLVGWDETNQPHSFVLRLLADDTQAELFALAGEFTTGRPPTIPPGNAQRWFLALNSAPRFEAAGPYVVQLLVDGQELQRTSFDVIDGTPPQG